MRLFGRESIVHVATSINQHNISAILLRKRLKSVFLLGCCDLVGMLQVKGFPIFGNPRLFLFSDRVKRNILHFVFVKPSISVKYGPLC